MASITVEELRARRTGLLDQRAKEQATYQARETGYAFVLGELEAMIAELESREALEQAAAAELAALEADAGIDPTPEEKENHDDTASGD